MFGRLLKGKIVKKEKIILKYNRNSSASDSMGASLSGKNANIILRSKMGMLSTIFFKVLCITMTSIIAQAQVIDSFSDGDFTSDPTWGGTTAEWTIVTDSDVAAGATNSYTLRNNLLVGDATLYLSTQRTTWGSSQSWSFWMGIRGITPSANDNNSIWLWANESNLISGTIDGYRVNFGQVGADNIFLQIVTNGLATNIITSTGAVPTLLTDFGFMVRVTRSSGSVWTLYTSSLPTVVGTGSSRRLPRRP
ncbi:MAG: hypothetical protein H8D42_04620, partial [Candidatus Marinimicrobia bacterium]|nr:hypothetical protein [Candidatus Neomarinimicrobiota bacterium]